MKRITLVLVLILTVSVLSGCVSPFYAYVMPSEQEGTTWQSADGRITFVVNDDPLLPEFGWIETEDGSVEMAFHMSVYSSDIEVEHAEDVHNWEEDEGLNSVELWMFDEMSRDCFSVEVIKTKYFNEGDVLTFYRVDDANQ